MTLWFFSAYVFDNLPSFSETVPIEVVLKTHSILVSPDYEDFKFCCNVSEPVDSMQMRWHLAGDKLADVDFNLTTKAKG